MLALEQQSPTAAHWPESSYRGLFDQGARERISLIAEDDGEVAGFLIARIAGDECELENVVVSDASRRRGVASGLIRELGKLAGGRKVIRVFLEVRESNAAARALYEKCGFAIHGCRKSYYSVPAEDAIVYTLAL